MSLDLHPLKRVIKLTLFSVLIPCFLASCATGEINELVTCSTDAECLPGQFCNQLVGTCAPTTDNNGTSNNGNNGTNANNGNNGNTANNGNTDDMGSDGPACLVTCADNQVCEDGTCVSACDPSCEAPGFCTADGCDYPDCTAEREICNPARLTQGTFSCLANPEGVGSCFLTCEQGYVASNCGVGQYCFEVGETSDVKVCLNSECQVDGDCTAETCANFDNSFGLCLTSGPKTAGSVCNTAVADCEVGTFCLAPSGSSEGVCTELCDLFGASSCGIGRVCGPLFTSREGFCSSDTTSTGSEPFQICSSTGDYCDDGMRCWPWNETQSACVPYCRPATSDCVDTLPVGWVVGSTDGVCDNYVFPGDRSMGLCASPCDPNDADPCGPKRVCPRTGPSANVCRRVCTSATLAADCCGGTTPCSFTCGPDGLCE